MPKGQVPGLDKPVSRLVMGCDNQRTMPHAAAMWDDWFERGGNAFDTSWVYAGGVPERLLGNWMRHRGVRDDCAVIVKGAHTPLCTPDFLTAQLHKSLDRLQTDHADLYIMHRDNPDIPVGEFIDVLDETHAPDESRYSGVPTGPLNASQKPMLTRSGRGVRGLPSSITTSVSPGW